MQLSNVVPLRSGSSPRLPLLVLIDLQREYSTEGRRHFISGIEKPLANCRRLLTAARVAKWPIANGRLLQRGNYFNPKTPFSDWVEGFRPHASDMVFERGEPSCFTDRGFAEILEHGAGDVLIVAGFTGTRACLSTVLDASARGHKVVFAEDASASPGDGATSEDEAHTCARFVISQHAQVARTDEIIRMFSEERGACA